MQNWDETRTMTPTYHHQFTEVYLTSNLGSFANLCNVVCCCLIWTVKLFRCSAAKIPVANLIKQFTLVIYESRVAIF